MSLLTNTRRRVTILVSALAALSSVACGGAGDDHPAYAGGDTEFAASVNVTSAGSSCELGAVQSCNIWLGMTGDLANCAKGVEVCTDAGWSECIDQNTMAENPELYSEMTGLVDDAS